MNKMKEKEFKKKKRNKMSRNRKKEETNKSLKHPQKHTINRFRGTILQNK
jgi:hypothetical protein